MVNDFLPCVITAAVVSGLILAVQAIRAKLLAERTERQEYAKKILGHRWNRLVYSVRGHYRRHKDLLERNLCSGEHEWWCPDTTTGCIKACRVCPEWAPLDGVRYYSQVDGWGP